MVDFHGLRLIAQEIRPNDGVEVPIFDGAGYPRHQRGVTAAEGLYVVGLPWLYTWGSGRFGGVGDDAEHLATHIEARRREAAMPLAM